MELAGFLGFFVGVGVVRIKEGGQERAIIHSPSPQERRKQYLSRTHLFYSALCKGGDRESVAIWAK